jgi:tyrosine-protein kinase Etk/Wzc
MSSNLSQNSQQSFESDDNLELKRFLSLFLSNWYWFATALFISISFAYGINRYSEKVYDVSATLLIKEEKEVGVNAVASSVIPGGDIFRSQQNMTNELAILRSFNLNYMVMQKLKDFHVVYTAVGTREIAKLKLYKTAPFRVMYDSLELEPKEMLVGIKILSEQKYRVEIDGDLNIEKEMSFGERFSGAGFNFLIEKANPQIPIYIEGASNKYNFYFTDPVRLANQYRSKLIASPVEKGASLVSLSVSGYVPEQERDYLDTLMSVYITYGLDFKKKIAVKTIAFINDQIDTISVSLEVASDSLENFRKANRFVSLSNEGSIIQGRLEKSENEKALFEMQVQYYNFLSEYLNNKKPGDTIVSPSFIGLTDPTVSRLFNDLSTLLSEREKLVFNLGDNQPAIELIDRKAEQARKALMENIKNSMKSLTQSIAEAEKKVSLIETEINKLPSKERKLIRIQRQFDLNNTVYTYLLEKRAEAGIARASTLADNRIIDQAQSGAPVKPKTKNNYIIALVLGFLFPAGLIFMVDFFNDKVIDKKDIEKKTKVPVIGYINHSDSVNEIAVVEKPGSLLSESFRSVRTAIKYYVRENEKAVIAVSSTISAEGKTFISINLAAITAMVGKKVLLVGFDLRRPRINMIFGYDNSCSGMSTYLSSNCEYEEIIRKTTIENLFYAPSGPIPPNPAELIETEQMKKFMVRAKSEFDFIIFDTPPVAIVTDTILLAPFVDVSLFVVRQRYSSRNTLELIEEMHNLGQLKNMAIVMNDVNLMGYYGYGMRYGYMRGYGFLYGNAYYGSNYYGRYYKSDKSKGYYRED